MADGVSSRAFGRFAGGCALLVAAVSVLYTTSYVINRVGDAKWADVLADVLFIPGGLLTTAVFVALYERLRAIDAGFALLAAVLGLSASMATAIHGAYHVAQRIDPPRRPPGIENPIDPREFMSYAVGGLALLLVAWLVARAPGFPRLLARLAAVAGVILVGLYAIRLLIVEADNAVLITATAVAGFVTTPAFYAWLGLVLLRGAQSGRPEAT